MNELDLMSPSKVASKYGGDKRKIAEAAQMGLIDPTVAVMAGMFIDRMRGAAAQEATPQTSVAQEVMTPAAGLAALPVPEEAVPDEYAGGGVVAFAAGGTSQMELDQEAMIDTLKRMGYSMADIATMVPRGVMGAFNAGVLRPARAITGLDIPYAKDILAPEGSNFSSMTPFYDQLRGSKAPPPLKDLPQSQADYADETTRGTARRVAAGGPGRNMEEFGIGAAEMAAKRAADETTKKSGLGTAVPTSKAEPTEDFLARRKRMLKESGVSEDPFAEDRAAAKARAEEIAAKRKENQAISMIMAGLSGMSGRNLADFAQKAGTAGFGQYAKGEKELREEQREIDKINRDLRKADDALKRGDVDKALEYEDKAKQRDIQLLGVQAQERAAAKPSSITELFAIQQKAKAGDPAAQEFLKNYLGAAKTGQLDDRFLMDLWSKMKPVEKLQLQQQGIGYEQWAAGKRAEAAGGGAGGFRVLGKE